MREYSTIAGFIGVFCYAYYLGRVIGRKQYRDELLRGVLDQFSAAVPERVRLSQLILTPVVQVYSLPDLVARWRQGSKR